LNRFVVVVLPKVNQLFKIVLQINVFLLSMTVITKLLIDLGYKEGFVSSAIELNLISLGSL
jgi:hypothetical protein